MYVGKHTDEALRVIIDNITLLNTIRIRKRHKFVSFFVRPFNVGQSHHIVVNLFLISVHGRLVRRGGGREGRREGGKEREEVERLEDVWCVC